jgi:hypothetical protein
VPPCRGKLDDGTLRVSCRHTSPGASEFFGDAITSHDWAYVITPDRVGTVFTLLGGQAGDDVLDLLATYHDQHAGRSTIFCEALKSPLRSAIGIAKHRSARDPVSIPVLWKLSLSKQLWVFRWAADTAGRVTAPQPRTEPRCPSSCTLDYAW